MNIKDRIKEFKRVPFSSLIPNPNNWRTHPEKQRAAFRGILSEVGIAGAVLAYETGDGLQIIDGHLRVEEIGLNAQIPVLVLDVSNQEANKLLLTFDPITDLAGINDKVLQELLSEVEFQSLAAQALLDELMNELPAPERPVKEDNVPECAKVSVAKSGDIWMLGNHRLMCGDSTNSNDVARLMAGKKADLCFTSPPYGQQRDYTEESKEMVSDWDGLMQGVFGNLPMTDAGQVLVNLGLIHRDGEWIPYWDNWIQWMREQGWRRFAWYVWDQGSGMPGNWNGRLAPSHEFIWHFNKSSIQAIKSRPCKHAGEKHSGKGQRAKDGTVKERSSGHNAIQEYAIQDSVLRINRQGAANGAGDHPAPFPVGLPALIMQSWKGDIFEPFSGSGTTLIAAEQIGRKCFAMEISPSYCDIIIERWQNLTGLKATRFEG